MPVGLALTGMVLLASGVIFGFLGSLQYLLPSFAKEALSFERMRPIHVSSALFWIILTAIGMAFIFLNHFQNKPLRYTGLLKLIFYLLLATITAIFISYFTGRFGGREYWEFPPALGLPLMIAWISFLALFFANLDSLRNRPVYVWMWATGFVFLTFTFIESYLWTMPWFRNHIVNDMTIQWKSYGSMVGAWNMLIYGSGIFLLDKIAGEEKYCHSKMAFGLYFLGLFNLMFNWGHHIYTLPTYPWVKHIAYMVSMTELFIFGRIVYQWSASLSTAKKHQHLTSYRFIIVSDLWVFLTLLLALPMSVPAINVYTHGTHITVAHAMGATIGINTMLLLSFITYYVHQKNESVNSNPWITNGLFLTAGSLFLFWISLIWAGINRGLWQMAETREPFGVMFANNKTVFILFSFSGGLVMIGLLMMLLPLIREMWRVQFDRSS